MNFNWKERSVYLQVLLGCLLCIFLTGLFYVITFRRPSVLGLEVFARANSTRTALALTSRALYGPFPTATGPTPTPSKTPTTTPTPTITPTNTDTPTPIRYFIDTVTPRTTIPHGGMTLLPGSTSTLAPVPTYPVPTSTRVFPTIPPIQSTNTPVPPIQPTQPLIRPTNTSAPLVQPTPCQNPNGHPIPCH